MGAWAPMNISNLTPMNISNLNFLNQNGQGNNYSFPSNLSMIPSA